MLALFQFDAAALPVVERMLGERRLPVLEELRRSGRWHTVDAGATVLQSATYPTLYTGEDVRRHGIYSTYPWSPPDQRVRHVETLPKPLTIWERVSEAGGRSLIVDPYISWPPAAMNGIFLSGWQFEDRMTLRAGSVPAAARSGLVRSHGRPPRLDDVYGVKEVDALRALRDRLVAAPGRTAQAVTGLLRKETFDLLWVTFASAHKAGHQLWAPETVVAGSPSPETVGELRAGLDDVYAAVDRALGRILAELPAGSDVIVFSPTGMGANTSRSDLLPGMLARVLAGTTPSTRTQGAPIWRLRAAVPIAVRSAIAEALPDRVVADLTTRLHARSDWSRTTAFTVPGENKGYVRLNLRGREREGIVDEADAEQLLEEIADGLAGFRDPDGSPAVSRVIGISELEDGGPISSRLPDLVVAWGEAPRGQITHLVSDRFGTVQRNGTGSGRSGNHVDDAWALVVPGRSQAVEPPRPLRITDIGATVCAVFEADSAGLSGDPLLETSTASMRQPEGRVAG